MSLLTIVTARSPMHSEMVQTLQVYSHSNGSSGKRFPTMIRKPQECFTNFPSGGSIETFELLVQKFTFHFASKRKQKRSATYLFNIRQNDDESLKNYIGRFNNEILEVQDLRRTRSRGKFHDRECKERKDKGERENAPVKGVINTIAGGPLGGDSKRTRKQYERSMREDRRKELVMNVEAEEEIIFGPKDLNSEVGLLNDPMLIKMYIANFSVHKVLVDNGSSVDIIFWDVLRRMDLKNTNLDPVQTPLVGFGGSEVTSLGFIDLPVSLEMNQAEELQ
ncbi:hypothetical protein Sango_2433500 [Sesamum angolense]|uniref:Retrotransposon gag domain-containing protein n=1 Tax=Sesamum angolense TaxID=2727404 RepID=A0AAE1W7R7_9LAMI|nr:hypothetical protein Sango_2433500 [Sesamum angolense]